MLSLEKGLWCVLGYSWGLDFGSYGWVGVGISFVEMPEL